MDFYALHLEVIVKSMKNPKIAFVGWAVPTSTVKFALEVVCDKSNVVVRSAHPTIVEESA